MERQSKRSRVAPASEPDPFRSLERDRYRNNKRLKGAFENIFLKYARDFTNIGDEIDLETGEIVVNNGHISRMQNEQDVGEGGAGAILKAFTEDIVAGMSDGDDAEEPPENGTAVTPRLNQNVETEDPDDSEKEVVPPATTVESNTSIGLHKPDAAAFEALGQSIAMQIARFMGQWQASPPALDSLWNAPPLPERTRYRRLTSESLSGFRQHRPVSPPTGSLWAAPDPPSRRRVSHSVSRRFTTERRSSPQDNVTPYRDPHGEGQDLNSDQDDERDTSNENLLTNLDGTRQAYSANTSAKRTGSGRKSRYHFSEEDDNLLIELKEEHQFPWATICSYWPDRPSWIVQHYYHKHLKNRNGDIADAITGHAEGADDEPTGPAFSEERATQRNVEPSSFPMDSGDPDASSSPAQSCKTPSRKFNPRRTIPLRRNTALSREPAQQDVSGFDTTFIQEDESSCHDHSEVLEGRCSLEIASSQESIESSLEILETVEPDIVPRNHSIRKKRVANKDRKTLNIRHSRLASGISSSGTPLLRQTPQVVKATPRAEKRAAPEVESEGSDEESGYSGLVNISDVIASPMTPQHKKHRNRRSGTKPPSRRVSNIRFPIKFELTPGKNSGLKRMITMCNNDDDESPDELALV